jgi:hypothetical protein
MNKKPAMCEAAKDLSRTVEEEGARILGKETAVMSIGSRMKFVVGVCFISAKPSDCKLNL